MIRTPTNDVRKTLEVASTLRWFHWTVVALSLGLTIFAWHFSREQLHQKVSSQFDREAEQVVELVIERMRKYEDTLWAAVSFIDTNDGEIDLRLWERYATSIQVERKYPGINGIGMIAALNSDQVPAFLDQQRTVYSDFSIHPARIADEYWPVRSIIPLNGNEKSLGRDMAHEANRIAAARKARESATAQITGPIVLVQDTQNTPGFLFFAPYYKPQAKADKANSQREFVGLVHAPFVFQNLMEGALHKRKRQISIRVTDASQELFDEHLESDADFDPKPLLKKEISVALYGRTWTFDIWSDKSFRQNLDATQPATILITGFIINGLLVALFLMISRASRKTIGFAEVMTADLEKLSLAARVNQIGVWDYDPVNGELDWNEAMFELYGRRWNEFSGGFAVWIDCLHPEDRSASLQALDKALADGNSFDLDFRVIHPDGKIRHISAKAMVFRDQEGRAVRMLGTNTDVTDRKTAALELDATRRLQAAIQEAAGVAIIATDPGGVIVTFNSTAEQMLGYSKEEMLFQQTPGIFHDPAEVSVRASELSEVLKREIQPGFDVFVAKAADGGSEQREWTYVRKDGSTLPVLLTVTALRDQDDTISGYLGIATDISERKLSLLKIERANASLARSNEELAQFAYVASHDLQEPLRKVISFCELLKEDCSDQLSGDAKQYMAYVVDGAARMRAMIRDLLSYSRIESDCRKTTNLDTNEAIRFAIDNLSEAIREADAEVTFDDLPSVDADSGQLSQLFQNLIGNAIKYRGDKAPCIHVSGQALDSHWTFAVEDNGIGIAPSHREQIFGIFKRLHNQNEYKGTGIGLAVCKRIVERLGGRIWVDASTSGGSVFRFDVSRAKC